MVICSTIANGIRNRSQERKVPMVEGIKASSKKFGIACVYDRVLDVSGFDRRSYVWLSYVNIGRLCHFSQPF